MQTGISVPSPALPQTNDPPATGDGHIRLEDNISTPFHHIWVALSGRDAVVRIDTDHVEGDGVVSLADSAGGSGAVLGEYLSAPNNRGGNPSRTTVDQNGDVWVGNRAESAGGLGSVVKIEAAPTGTTSTGVWNGGTFDRLTWANGGGVDDAGGTSTASDTAITEYVRTAGTLNRSLAVDAQNDVWIGGFGNKTYEEYDENGNLLTGAFTLDTTPAGFGGGGYGALVDGNGILWAAGWSDTYISRYDTTTNTDLGDVATGGASYGLGIDSNGNVWNSHFGAATISKHDSAGNLIFTVSTGVGTSGGRGVAVTTADDNVWVANSFTGNVTRLDSAGNVVGIISVGATPTGVAVDNNGKVWVTNFSSNNVMRIDPTLGAFGAVDLTVELGANANPYNYSDMTGTVSVGTTNPSGFWNYTQDSGVFGEVWDQIFWNEEIEGSIPTGTSILLEARAANSLGALSGMGWMSYNSSDLLGLTGQYLEIRATLTRTGGGVGAPTPVLSDLRITSAEVPEPSTLALLGGGLLLLSIRRRSMHR